jgi:hypothetical protein
MRLGLKRNETRSWPISYRGDLMICSSKRTLDQVGLEVAREHNIPLTGMKFGYALCIVELYGCIEMSRLPVFPITQTELELSLGDYSPGRFVWLTRNLRVLDPPVPVTGRQGLFEVTL